ncbi:MAG: hypothetical protein NVSMB42_27210 [Herpetosiphon sp.]
MVDVGVVAGGRAKVMPLVVVLPWYGPETVGGAEDHARGLVRTFHHLGVPVEVWTTTARDARAQDVPFYREGWSVVDDVPVRRFAATRGSLPAVARRQPSRFGLQQFAVHELQLLASLTGSDGLLDALITMRDARRWLFFLYAFPTTFFGALLAGTRGVVIPCLHDEPYARYQTTRYLLRQVPHVLANSEVEARLINEVAGVGAPQVAVVGEGIDLQATGDAQRFRERFRIEEPFVFFVGRRDHSKNFPLLLAYMERYWREHGPLPQLVVAGAGRFEVPLPLAGWVHDLGFISAQDKHDAYAAASVFCMPGVFESFSIVVMEAWLQGTPVLVHGDCPVTVEHCQRSGGGLWFRSPTEFTACLDRLLDADIGPVLGQQGKEWVVQECDWNDVARRVFAALG